MLDENLPTFYTKPSSENPLSSTIFLSQNASELQPEYTLRRPDPSLPASKNCYAVALYDSYNPEVLYAEVLVQPEWTQPTLSAAEIRAQNGIPAPPVPIIPNQFVIQLYNPDQQVVIRQVAGSWNSSAYWEFEMPQNSFRLPSASALDRSQNDPAASDVTPKISFKWKKDGKLSKDITCYLAGKSTNERRGKEPDITVAMYKGGKNLTLYEPNLHRVDVEDVKGLEVVLLLGAAVIKDIFFNANREMFNISSPDTNTTPANKRRKSTGPVIPPGKPSGSAVMSGAVLSTSPTTLTASSYNTPPTHQQPANHRHPPVSNPRSQWEIDAETARLKALVEAEEAERERQELKEQKRIKKMLEAEEKEQKRRDAEIAKETERLRKQYGVTAAMDPSSQSPAPYQAPSIPPRPHTQMGHYPASQQQQQQQGWNDPASGSSSRPPSQRPVSTSGAPNASLNTWLQRPGASSSGPYLQAPGQASASSSGFFGLGGGKKVQKKRSVFF